MKISWPIFFFSGMTLWQPQAPWLLRNAAPGFTSATPQAPGQSLVQQRPVRVETCGGLSGLTLQPLAAGSGELQYQVRWGGFELGEATFSFLQNQQLYVSRGRIKTTPVVGMVYSLDSRYEAQTQKDTLRPLFAKLDAKENGKTRKVVSDFGEDGIRLTSLSNGRQVRTSMRASDSVLDPLTAMLWLRQAVIPAGSSVCVQVLVGRDLWKANIRNTGQAALNLGENRFLTNRYAIDIPRRGAVKPQHYELYLSADALHLPLKLTGETSIGQIEVLLTKYHDHKTTLEISDNPFSGF